jgi:hypothetical protein
MMTAGLGSMSKNFARTSLSKSNDSISTCGILPVLSEYTSLLLICLFADDIPVLSNVGVVFKFQDFELLAGKEWNFSTHKRHTEKMDLKII